MKVNNGSQERWYPYKNQKKVNDGFESTEAGSREIIEDHLIRAGVLPSYGLGQGRTVGMGKTHGPKRHLPG